MADEKLQVSNPENGHKHRKIRSFDRREGRLTVGKTMRSRRIGTALVLITIKTPTI